jgi:hypothetical protein
LKIYTHIFTLYAICWYTYVDFMLAQTYVEYTRTTVFCLIYEHSECKGAQNECGNSVDYIFLVLLKFKVYLLVINHLFITANT